MMKESKAYRIAKEGMYDNDPFSQWLGIKILDIQPGQARLQMMVREEMTNGFKIAHGGITYSLADSAFAFASNSRGRHAVSIETSIAHTRAVKVGDELTAVATEESLSNRLGHYLIRITNQRDEVVGLFKGMVYRKDTEWEM